MRKIYILLTALCIIAALTACSNPLRHHNAEGTITIAFGGRARTMAEPLVIETYLITLTGPGGATITETVIRPAEEDMVRVSFEVQAGVWEINIRASGPRPDDFADAFPEGPMLRALGFGTAVVVPGQSAPARIYMTRAVEVTNYAQLYQALSFDRYGEYIVVMNDISAEEEFRISDGTPRTLFADNDVTIYREHDLSLFFILDSSLTLGRPGSRGTIRIDGMGLPATVPLIEISGDDSVVVMHEGVTLTGNDNEGNGGGVRIDSGTFTMHGGEISGNIANFGGGVRVAGRAIFNMYGGIISGNTAYAFGGDGGGGVFVDGAAFNMRGGTISANRSYTGGGGVFVSNGATFTMNGGTISGNYAVEWGGGGVFIDNHSIFTMNSTARIYSNNAVYGSGGGVLAGGGASFNMYGGEIFYNTAAGGGGGVSAGVFAAYFGRFFMTGGTIFGNTAYGSGGGVFIERGNEATAAFTMIGGTITGNNARSSHGGGIYVDGGFNMAGNNNPVISSNTASFDGGGVYVGRGTFTIFTGTISGGNTAERGGGVFVGDSGTFIMSGGGISGNIAPEGGASIFVEGDGIAEYAGDFSVYGGYILTTDAALPYRRGDGTAADPFLIFTEAQLRMVGRGLYGWVYDAYYRLMASITLTGGEWVPIAPTAAIGVAFTGTFDGNGHVITGLTITGSTESNQGMFGVIGPGGMVKDLGLANVYIRSGGNMIGGITGQHGGFIERVFVTGRIENTRAGASAVGGIAGSVSGQGIVRNVYSTADVIDSTGAFTSTGGIAGQTALGGTVTHSFATGTVTANPLAPAGGIIGMNSGTVQNSVALNPTISGQNSNTHRIAGTGTAQNNHARHDMLVNNGIPPSEQTLPTTLHGGTIDHTSWHSAPPGFWDSIGFQSAVWDIASGRLPILQDFAPGVVQNPTVLPIP